MRLLDRVNTDNLLGVRSSFLPDQSGDGDPALPSNPLDGVAQAFQLAYDASDFDGVIRLLETQGNVQVISSPRVTTLNNQKAVFKVGDEVTVDGRVLRGDEVDGTRVASLVVREEQS